VAGRIIHKSQTAFLKGRNIINSVLALHEILHEIKKNRKIEVVLKLDFEKAYDKVHWGFLLQCLEKRGFCSVWCDWIRSVLENGTVAIKLNDSIWPYFLSHNGVRQGDPLSPILFNIVADILTRMTLSSERNGLIVGLIDNLIPKGVAILQYADDTIMRLANDEDKARNVKLLLYIFEQMSDLKINFEKSEVLIVGGDNNVALRYANLFDCQVGMFPLKYLGVPIAASRLHVVDWARVEEKSAKKIDIW
jgi:hypothetical protein